MLPARPVNPPLALHSPFTRPLFLLRQAHWQFPSRQCQRCQQDRRRRDHRHAGAPTTCSRPPHAEPKSPSQSHGQETGPSGCASFESPGAHCSVSLAIEAGEPSRFGRFTGLAPPTHSRHVDGMCLVRQLDGSASDTSFRGHKRCRDQLAQRSRLTARVMRHLPRQAGEGCRLASWQPPQHLVRPQGQSPPAELRQGTATERRQPRPPFLLKAGTGIRTELNAAETESFNVMALSGCCETPCDHACPLPKLPMSSRLNRVSPRRGQRHPYGVPLSSRSC